MKDKIREMKLKPCPFCGKKARLGSLGGDKSNWLIWCKCGHAVSETGCGYGDTKEEIIKAWNTRAEDKVKAKMLEALREIDKQLSKLIYPNSLENEILKNANQAIKHAEVSNG